MESFKSGLTLHSYRPLPGLRGDNDYSNLWPGLLVLPLITVTLMSDLSCCRLVSIIDCMFDLMLPEDKPPTTELASEGVTISEGVI